MQQLRPEACLQVLHLAADGRLGHAQQARCSGETASLDDASEHHDIVEIDHYIQI